MFYVYGLYHSEVRPRRYVYVGETVDIEQRREEHLTGSKASRRLLRQNKFDSLEIFAFVSPGLHLFYENWISYSLWRNGHPIDMQGHSHYFTDEGPNEHLELVRWRYLKAWLVDPRHLPTKAEWRGALRLLPPSSYDELTEWLYISEFHSQDREAWSEKQRQEESEQIGIFWPRGTKEED